MLSVVYFGLTGSLWLTLLTTVRQWPGEGLFCSLCPEDNDTT